MTAAPLRGITAALVVCANTSGQLVSVDPENLPVSADIRRELTRAVHDESWPEAEALLFREAAARPESAALLRALAAAHFRNERYLPAASAYLRADRLTPLDAASRFALATAYIALDRRHWARRELERLMAEFPRNPLYPHWLAGVLQHLQWFDLAVAQARRAIELAPEYASAHDRLGQCLEALGRTEEALGAYAEAVRLAEEAGEPSSWANYHQGGLLRQAGRFQQARESLRRAVEIDPAHAEAHYELGLVLGKLDDWNGAQTSLETAARLAPEDAKIHYALAQARRRTGNIEGAEAALEKFRTLSPASGAR